MSLDTSLSPGEEAFLASRGQNAEALVAENPEIKSGYDPGEGKPFVETERVAEASPQEAQLTDQATEGQVDPQTGHPKRIRYAKYRESLDRIAQLEAENRERASREAVLDERLRLINEALQEDQAPVVDEDPEPDKLQDAYGWMEWQNRQRERDKQEFQNYLQQQQATQEQQQLVAVYKHSMETAAQQHPVLGPAYHYLMQHRAQELALNRQDLSLQQRQLMLQQEELALAHREISEGRNPANLVYQLAVSRGFNAQGNGATPTYAPSPAPSYAPAANAAPMYAPPPGSSSAVEQVQAIARNQAAARSLSNGGGAPLQNIDARALASMSEEEFQAVFNRLQGSGDKARLRELMGF